MLQKMGDLLSLLAPQMGSRQKCQISQDSQNVGGHGQSICFLKWPNLVANRGSKLTESWGTSASQEDA